MSAWDLIVSQLPGLLLEGLPPTIYLTAISIAFGTLIGLVVAIGKQSKVRAILWACSAYSWLFRSLPALLTLFYIYYALPQIGVRFDSFTAAAVGLSLVAGAYFAEVVRSGFAAIPRGQYEASKSLGMSPGKTTRRIILPQVARVIVAPYISQCVMVVKSSALASLVAVNELTGVAYAQMSYTFRPLEILLLVWVIYLAVNSVLVGTQLYIERRLGGAGAMAHP
jgi:His/Glu/Gln/Arg/opine family amino acid ABC transporter permease subunit